MDVFKYPYESIGEYVVIGTTDDDKTLIYSITGSRCPKFALLITSMHERCPCIGSSASVTEEDIIDEFIAFKLIMDRDARWSLDKGKQNLLTACQSFLGNDKDGQLMQSLIAAPNM